MLKLTPYADAQPVQLTNSGKERRDAYQNPLRTVYLKSRKGISYTGMDYCRIRDHQLNFYDYIEQTIALEPEWCHSIGLFNLTRVYNDPEVYQIREIIDDTRNQYQKNKDPRLSMILRQNWLARALMGQLECDLSHYFIDCQWQNPDIPALKQLKDLCDFSWLKTEPKDILFGTTQ